MAKQNVNPVAAFNGLMKDLKAGTFKPVYLFDGEEPFYIDELISFFEDKILAPEEKDFNLITLYGKETTWSDVINAARRFPMFAERQVVILKEAGQLDGINELAGYMEHPMATTVLVIDHRNKKASEATKWVKALKKTGIYITFDRLNDAGIPSWIVDEGKGRGITVGEHAAQMLTTYLGSDLQVISNELGKIKLNEPDMQELTPALIEKYIGISRDYNVFELPEVLFAQNHKRLARMMVYFLSNPGKTAPMPLVIGTFYNYLTRVYSCYFVNAALRKDFSYGIFAAHRHAAQQYSLDIIERAFMVLKEYSLKGVGMNTAADSGGLLKEMIGKFNYLVMHGR